MTELSEEKFENAENAENLNPFGDDLEAKALDDTQVQDYIHEMSHQKLKRMKSGDFILLQMSGLSGCSRGLKLQKTI